MKKFTTIVSVMLVSFSFFGLQIKAQQIAPPNATNLEEQNTMSVLWFQKSGEAKALYYQGYNIGKMRLDEILKSKKYGLKPAIVLDIDETIVDNSPYLAWNVQTRKKFDVNWNQWVQKAESRALPGALAFLKYADSKGVAIYYISNRQEAQKVATIKVLHQIGAPQANSKHVLLQQPGEIGKEIRRAKVAATHDIVLLFGDNLNDFSGFDGLSVSGRIQAVDRRKDEFGKKLIVFPNPMYGDWEGAIYNYNEKKSDSEKAKLRKESLEVVQP
ncbi:MAG: 5'-nucleotidase, lipoprotein e(P4) family [Bacillota bacterium]|nr:5'-nucleotidase, lipoprotein e(P4) family [Bacillota bacterium]